MSDSTDAGFEPAFQPGDVVQLRSGGPFLTVQVSTANKTYVIYFNATTGKFDTFGTPHDCLRAANQAPQVPMNANALRQTTVTKATF